MKLKEAYSSTVWQDWEDTEIEGAKAEMAIDNLIDEATKRIEKECPEAKYGHAERKRIVDAFQKLWIEKIKNWKI
jgi:hypothetical protein